jgi:ankyrin repeat protein
MHGDEHPAVALLQSYQASDSQDEPPEPEKEEEEVNFTLQDVQFLASNRRKVERFREYLSQKPSYGDQLSSENTNAFHIAARFGNTGGIEALLEAGCDHSIRNQDGMTPLDIILTTHGDQHSAVTLLRNHGASESVSFTMEDVHFGAASKGHVDELREFLLIKPKWGDQVDANGWNALHVAARAGNTKGIEALLEAGCDKTILNNAKLTPLDIVIENHGASHAAAELLRDD